MEIRNDVTYTIWSEAMKAHMENHTVIYHNRKLTHIGAQRMIRKEHPQAIVTRIEAIGLT